MSGKHRWRRNRPPAPPGYVPIKIWGYESSWLNNEEKQRIKLYKEMIEREGVPEANKKAGLPAFLFGLPVVVED